MSCLQLDFVHSEQGRVAAIVEKRESEIQELRAEKDELELMFNAHGEDAPTKKTAVDVTLSVERGRFARNDCVCVYTTGGDITG